MLYFFNCVTHVVYEMRYINNAAMPRLHVTCQVRLASSKWSHVNIIKRAPRFVHFLANFHHELIHKLLCVAIVRVWNACVWIFVCAVAFVFNTCRWIKGLPDSFLEQVKRHKWFNEPIESCCWCENAHVPVFFGFFLMVCIHFLCDGTLIDCAQS